MGSAGSVASCEPESGAFRVVEACEDGELGTCKEERARKEHRAMEGVNSYSRCKEAFSAFKVIPREEVALLCLWRSL